MIEKYLIILITGIIAHFVLKLGFDICQFTSAFRKKSVFKWIFILVIVMAFFPFGAREAYEGGQLGISRTFRLFGFAVIFLKCLFYIERFNIFNKIGGLIFFFFYVMICLFSMVYSPNHYETIWKSFELLTFFFTSLVVKHEINISRISGQDIIYSFIFFLYFSVLLSILGIVLFPDVAMGPVSEVVDQSRSYWGIIPTINPNTLGQFGAMLAFSGSYFFLYLRDLRKTGMLFFVMGLSALLLAYSRTSIIAFLLTIAFLFWFKKDRRGFLFGLLFGIFILIYAESIFHFISRGQNTDQLSSLSGRTYLWAIGWESFKNHPYLGIGYYAGHKALDIDIGMEFSSLDSTYLEVLVDVGLIGAFFLITFILNTLLKSLSSLRLVIRKNYIKPWIWLSSGFMIIMLIRSFTGPSFQVFHINLFLLLMIYISLQEFKLKGNHV